MKSDAKLVGTVLPKPTEQETWLQTLREIEERSRFMNPKPDERDLLREGRAGAMWADEQADDERRDWLLLSQQGLARAYSEDEPEYTLDMLQEVNPEYDPK